MTERKEVKQVGQLNGMWAVLFKAQLLALFPWMVWVSAHIWTQNEWKKHVDDFVEKGDRWTEGMALKQELRMVQLINKTFESMEQRLDLMDKRVQGVESNQKFNSGGVAP